MMETIKVSGGFSILANISWQLLPKCWDGYLHNSWMINTKLESAERFISVCGYCGAALDVISSAEHKDWNMRTKLPHQMV